MRRRRRFPRIHAPGSTWLLLNTQQLLEYVSNANTLPSERREPTTEVVPYPDFSNNPYGQYLYLPRRGRVIHTTEMRRFSDPITGLPPWLAGRRWLW